MNKENIKMSMKEIYLTKKKLDLVKDIWFTSECSISLKKIYDFVNNIEMEMFTNKYIVHKVYSGYFLKYRIAILEDNGNYVQVAPLNEYNSLDDFDVPVYKDYYYNSPELTKEEERIRRICNLQSHNMDNSDFGVVSCKNYKNDKDEFIKEIKNSSLLKNFSKDELMKVINDIESADSYKAIIVDASSLVPQLIMTDNVGWCYPKDVDGYDREIYVCDKKESPKRYFQNITFGNFYHEWRFYHYPTKPDFDISKKGAFSYIRKNSNDTTQLNVIFYVPKKPTLSLSNKVLLDYLNPELSSWFDIYEENKHTLKWLDAEQNINCSNILEQPEEKRKLFKF